MNDASANYTIVNRRGRKPSTDSFVTVSVCLTPEQLSYVKMWFPSGNLSQALRFLLDRAIKFWPLGPFVFGHSRKSGGAL